MTAHSDHLIESWRYEDLIELLAQLDFIVERSERMSLNAPGIDSRVLEVLNELSVKLDSRYTPHQIRQRLLQELQHGDAYPEHNLPRILILGSGEVCTLNEDTRQRVEQQVALIRSKASRGRRTKSIYESPPSQRRRPPPRASRSTTTPKIDERTALQRRKSGPGRSSNKIIKRETRSKSRTRASKSASILPSVEANQISRSCTQEVLSNNTSHRLEPPIDLERAIDKTKSVAWNTDDVSPSASTSRLTTPVSSIHMLQSISKVPYDDVFKELMYFKNLWMKTAEECKRLKKDMRQVESFYTQTKGVPERVLAELNSKNHRIDALSKQRNDQAYLKPYLALDGDDTFVPTAGTIHAAFGDMKSQILSLCVPYGWQTPPMSSVYGQSSELDSLLVTAFNRTPSTLNEDDSQDLANVPIRELLQSLIGAAIYRWIFSVEFYCVATTNTPLLQRYRDHIAVICGKDALSNLDSAAHQSLIEEEHFKDTVIPHLASPHTIRLLTALKPLIDAMSDPEPHLTLQSPLDQIFRHAIRIRSLSLVGTQVYEVIWPLHASYWIKTLWRLSFPVPMSVRALSDSLSFLACVAVLSPEI